MRRCAKLRGVLAAVSPLCGSSRQGAMAGGALCLPPCPLRLPLLFPKNLASLRFSGALFIFRGTPFFMRAAFTSIQTKSKQKGPALKGVFCAPCGSSSLQYRSGYCCFVYRPNPSQNALFQGA